jgi:Polyketide cyclase / dehydrase and lipid transport
MFSRILIVLVVVVGGFLAYAYTRPDTYRVERTEKIEAPTPVVYSQLEDFKAWGAWSPWDKLDPNMKKTFEGAPKGKGASYSWQGNDKVGKGKMTITDSQAPTEIKYRLEFLEPFAATANTAFKLSPEGDKATSVTWSMEGTNTLMGKVYGVFVNMDKAIGADFDKGLASPNTVAEAEAKKQLEIAAKAAAEAEAKKQAEIAAAAAATEAAAAAGKKKGKR